MQALPRGCAAHAGPGRAHARRRADYRDETGFIEARCNPHPDERAYVLVFDHPYAALSGKGGDFTIADVPAGTHTVRVWHAGVVTKGRPVVVEADGATDVVLELD